MSASLGPDHVQRGADAVRRDEAELPCDRGVAAAGDQHRPEPLERRAARLPVPEGQQWMAGAATPVHLEGAGFLGGAALRVRELDLEDVAVHEAAEHLGLRI